MIENENIESYINLESTVPKKKGLLSSLWIMLIVCIPSAIFGIYSDITKFIMLPLVLIMILWILYLLFNTDNKKLQFTLFLGIFSIFISVSFLIAAYKIAATKMVVSNGYVIIISMTYIITNCVSIFITLKLAQKGYFKVKRKTENPMGIISASSVLGLLIGKLLIGEISQNTVVTILVIGLLFLGFLFSIGSHNILKYCLAKKLQNNI